MLISECDRKTEINYPLSGFAKMSRLSEAWNKASTLNQWQLSQNQQAPRRPLIPGIPGMAPVFPRKA
jgi:hypothetical protein